MEGQRGKSQHLRQKDAFLERTLECGHSMGSGVGEKVKSVVPDYVHFPDALNLRSITKENPCDGERVLMQWRITDFTASLTNRSRAVTAGSQGGGVPAFRGAIESEFERTGCVNHHYGMRASARPAR